MSTVLVVGATGKVGRHVVAGLLDEGVAVSALTRQPETAALPAQVEVVEGDVGRPETIEAAVRGAQSAFLLWPGFDPAGAGEVVAALAGNVDHIVQLSSARLQGEEAGVTEGVWAEVERLVEASGVAWTFVRAGGFAANTLGWADTIRAGDPLRVAFPRAARSVVHERDIAEVAVRTLVDPGHVGSAYDVTGPEVLSQLQQVAIIGEVLGRAVAVEEKSADEAWREFASFMGADGADRAVAHWTSMVDSPERATHDVEQITGHTARKYSAWVRDHLDAFTPPVREGRI
jgi:uncharacterized protein YbjT (DUF2867 family)